MADDGLQDLAGRVAIVTGASSGIGAAVAERLDAEGMKVVITARRADRLEALAGKLSDAAIVAGDIADEAMPRRLVDTALERFGRCDVVFNNAGIMHVGKIEDVDVDALCRMVRVNVEAATRLAYVAMKHFLAAGRGDLINVSSVLGTKVRDTVGVYAATKYAMEALSEALRMEVAKSDIRVTALEPGLVETELQDHFPQHPRDLLGIRQPLRGADVARVVAFVLKQPAHVRVPVVMVTPGEQAM